MSKQSNPARRGQKEQHAKACPKLNLFSKRRFGQNVKMDKMDSEILFILSENQNQSRAREQAVEERRSSLYSDF
jgi:hypothetical protein